MVRSWHKHEIYTCMYLCNLLILRMQQRGQVLIVTYVHNEIECRRDTYKVDRMHPT